MEFFFGLLGLGLFFAPLIAVLIFIKRLKTLEGQFRRMEERLAEMERTGPIPEEPLPLEVEDLQERRDAIPDPVPEYQEPIPAEPARTVKSFQLPPILKRLEKQFLDNWTGVLGAIIIVLGTGFLSLYAALKMAEFARFLLLLLFAAIPAGLFFYLKDREHWQKQASWFRSISGAIFLFACLGSGGIPGLQWIHNPFQSLSLLILGIAVNLGLSSLGGKQAFASFHTLLSLLALAVIPPGTTSLVMALVICLYAIIQTFRVRWDLHLLLTITGFFAYHLYWMSILQKEGFSDLVRFQGAGAVAAVFLAAAFIHYRKNYATGRFELFPFLVHLSNWLYFTAGMILYSGAYQWRTIPLMAAAVVAMLLANLAGKKGISWLKTTDYTIMQALIVASLLTLKGWEIRGLMIGGMVFVETILFARIMVVQKNRLLYRIGMILSFIGGAVLIGVSQETSQWDYASAILPALATLFSLVHHRFVFCQEDPQWLKGDTLPGLDRLKKEFSLGGVMIGLLGLTVFGRLQDLAIPSASVYPMGAALLIILLWGRKNVPSRGLTFGVCLFLAGLVFSGWSDLLSSQRAFHHLLTSLSLLAASGMAVFALQGVGQRFKGTTFAWLLMTGTILFATFALLEPLSPLLPGIGWLLFSAGLASVPGIPEKVRRMGLVFLGAYLFRHFTSHIHLDASWGPVPQTYIMDLLVLPVFILWYRQRQREIRERLGTLMPFLLEITLIFLIVIFLIELSFSWIPFALECLAILILVAGRIDRDSSRLRLYSLFVNWSAILVLMAGVLSSLDDPVFPLGGALAMLAGMGYLVLSYRFAELDDIRTPPVLEGLNRLSLYFAGRFHPYILYPIILGCAFFILDAAARETRTFFWALECFLIYGASLFLREEHFRYVSQGGLFLCVVRLILVDMSGTTVLVRGLVFLGVGVMMLGVNVLYNRYKGRFLKDPAE